MTDITNNHNCTVPLVTGNITIPSPTYPTPPYTTNFTGCNCGIAIAELNKQLNTVIKKLDRVLGEEVVDKHRRHSLLLELADALDVKFEDMLNK